MRDRLADRPPGWARCLRNGDRRVGRRGRLRRRSRCPLRWACTSWRAPAPPGARGSCCSLITTRSFRRVRAALRPVRLEGDRALGPGVADMKGGVLVGLAALERLADSGIAVELHSVPDEESRNVAPFTLTTMHGADAALCLECGRESGAIVTSRKAGCWVTVTAHGVPAHAGTSPDEGRSALRALARELLRIEGELHHARPGMTAVATQLHSGEVKNTVPAEAWGVIDLRARRRARPRLRARPHPRCRPPRGRRIRVQRRPRLPADAARPGAGRRSAARSRRARPAGARGGGGRCLRRLLDEPHRRPHRRRPRARWAATTTPSASGSSSPASSRACGRSSPSARRYAKARVYANVTTPRPGAPERRSS